jgi:hypothetical protein
MAKGSMPYLVAIGHNDEVFLNRVAVFEMDDAVVGIYVGDWFTKRHFSFGWGMIIDSLGKLSQGSVERNSMPVIESATIHRSEIAEYLLIRSLKCLMIDHFDNVTPDRE